MRSSPTTTPIRWLTGGTSGCPGPSCRPGWAPRRTLKGGTGSGDVNSRHVVTIEEGLEKAGFTLTTKAWLDAYKVLHERTRADFIADIKAGAKAAGVPAVVHGMGAVMLLGVVAGRGVGDHGGAPDMLLESLEHLHGGGQEELEAEAAEDIQAGARELGVRLVEGLVEDDQRVTGNRLSRLGELGAQCGRPADLRHYVLTKWQKHHMLCVGRGRIPARGGR